MKTLQIGRESVGFVQRGHPWIRPDRWTRGLDRLRAGEVVRLIDERGAAIATALADPAATVCARVVPDGWTPATAVAKAWERRAPLHADPATDCYRIVHGEADALPGLRVERYGSVLSVVVTAACCVPWLDQALAALATAMPTASIVVHDHLTDLRQGGVRSRRWPDGTLDGDAVVAARELGVSYPLRPYAGIASGLYVDQRANRSWLRTRARDARILNLFAYTGAFSLSLLAAGASTATDVDLSQPALARASEAAAANDLSGHRTVRQDARGFCAGDDGLYDLVIIDPPTSAQGGQGWVARRDYPELLHLAWARVAPGGLLLATSNAIGKPFPLREALAAACRGGKPVATPQLGPDIPQRKGFPEGRPFRCEAMARP